MWGGGQGGRADRGGPGAGGVGADGGDVQGGVSAGAGAVGGQRDAEDAEGACGEEEGERGGWDGVYAEFGGTGEVRWGWDQGGGGCVRIVFGMAAL